MKAQGVAHGGAATSTRDGEALLVPAPSLFAPLRRNV